MGTATITRQPKARRFEAEWQTAPDRYVVLSCSHFPHSRSMIAMLRRERADRSVGNIESRIFAPFQDMQRIAVSRVQRYSAKLLEAFFEQELERVERVRDGDDGDPQAARITVMFEQPTTA